MIRTVAIILTFIAASKAATFSKRAAGGCVTQADITFLLDTSDSVGRDNFQKELEFTNNVVKDLAVGQDKVRVSAVTFGSSVYNQFFLNQYDKKNDVMHAISGIPYLGGRTYTAEAIKYASQTSFNPVHGARNNVPHITVLVTNGPSTNKDITKLQGQAAKDNNVIMYAVGVGGAAEMGELEAVSSKPDSRYLMKAENFASLNGLSDLLSTKLCNELPTNKVTLPAPTNCLNGAADVVFLVDSSNSVGPGNLQKIENFLKGAITKMDIGPNKVHVGVMQYSSYPSLTFPLNSYDNRNDAIRGVEQLRYLGGGTNTADAIKYMREQMFSQNSGARGNVPRVAIVLTDGGSANSAATTAEADKARQNHIGMIAVGVGNVKQNELMSIADSPASEHVINVGNYDNLDQNIDSVLQKACKVKTTAQSLVTAVPGGTLPPDTCTDKVNNCKLYTNKVCVDYQPWANDNCRRFCGFCSPLYTTAAPSCQDRIQNCVSYGQTACTKFAAWARDNCAQFCGVCDKGTSPVGFYGSCSYKSKTYKTGEKWLDGCDYECVCEDGNTGRYRCYNRCPLYYNLPKSCTLIKKPSACCLEPVCNFQQTINKVEGTGHTVSTTGIDVCVYKSKQYYQGQTWRDGCDFQCTCTNATKGLHRCDSICPTYKSIPSNCHLEQQPGECCQKPVCEFNQQHGSFLGTGTISGSGVGITPTTPKPCVDAVTTCANYGKAVCTNYAGWSSDNCRKFCGFCTVAQQASASPNEECIFEGVGYHKGKTWSNGCATTCTCEMPEYGYYRCNDACPTYNNLPTGCYMTKRAGECCSVVECHSGSFIPSTINLNSLGSGGTIHVLNPTGPNQFVIPTAPSGSTLAPGAGGTGFIAPTLRGCLYKGQLYVQDQSWEDGCSFSCNCKNAQDGTYSCRPKCPLYKGLPSFCHMETDVNDPCCQAPSCGYNPITGQSFLPIPTFEPAVTGHGVVEPPSTSQLLDNKEYTNVVELYQTGLTPAPPTENSHYTGGVGFCTYKGKQYSQGESWEDGCDYNCVCEDVRTGFYRCIEKCNVWGPLPQPYCFLVDDPSSPCCKIPKCIFNIHYITKEGMITTPTPPKDYCEYKGKTYQQGQSWYDGCSYRCTCEKGLGGVYRCLERCASYENISPSCTFKPDPQDPTCCQIPQCIVSGTITNTSGVGLIPTPAPVGVYNGVNKGTGLLDKCLYKGVQYKQGQRWDDGCDYTCVCLDSSQGHYQCSDKCARYLDLPPQCRLVSDFREPCCQKPVCDLKGLTTSATGTGPTPTPAPDLPPTLAPSKQYCIYNGANYIQGQTWEDGCNFKCRCDDASRGIYICNERCPKYPSQAGCQLVADPDDKCCLVPFCVPTRAPGLAPNSSVAPTLSPNQIPTARPGKISGSIVIPTPAPVPGGPTRAPQLLSACEYKGARYKQGDTWVDGCDYKCQCDNAAMGRYTCTEFCPRYVYLPKECTLVKSAINPCCKEPHCYYPPATGTGSGATPTPSPGYTQAPNPLNNIPTAAPGLREVCSYKGQTYTQGQQWYDGCDYSCVCENAVDSIYRCSQRCAAFGTLPSTCSLVPDPNDPICCKVPQCDYLPTNSSSGVSFQTAAPGTISGGSVNPTPRPYIPTPVPQPGVSTIAPSPGVTGAPTIGPQQGTLAPKFQDTCVYKGQVYTQGQKWQDGCDYSCECTDAKTGVYKCTERCTRFVNLPKGCQLISDYLNPCCKKPYCPPGAVPTRGPSTPGSKTTLKPGMLPPTTPAPDVCVYHGAAFQQGASWVDGCDLRCTCEDSKHGYYRCDNRCPSFSNLPATCTMETDPRDSCCKRPNCDPVVITTDAPNPLAGGTTPKGQTYAPGFVPTLAPGVPTPGPGQTYAPGMIPSLGPTPGPGVTLPNGQTLAPGLQPTPAPYLPVPTAPQGVVQGYGIGFSSKGKVCMYKGVAYSRGQKWQDGCTYNCQCIDDQTGLYQCVERCPVYTNVPSYCQLVVDPNDGCCKKAECIPPPGGVPTAKPGQPTLGPTLMPGQTPIPGQTNSPTPSPGGATLIPGLKDVCVYKGISYVEGQQWFDNCDKVCVCENAKTGYARCNDRCAKYENIPASCTLTADPNDPLCCQVPNCIPIPGVNGNPTPGPTDDPIIVTGVPGIISGGGLTPTLVPTRAPMLTPPQGQTFKPGYIPSPGVTIAPGVTLGPGLTLGPHGEVPRIVECVYKGHKYHPGQTWQDGCQYNCNCTGQGKYVCKERCATFPILPPQCTLNRDPNDFCCYVPKCDFNKPVPTPAPFIPTAATTYTGVPTPVYTGAPTPAPSGSTLAPGLTPKPGQTLAPNPGSGIRPPTPAPVLAYCIYNGVPFQQGQVWDQGCSTKCRCENAMTNYYSCYDRCPSFNDLLPGCVLVINPSDPCCKIPDCPAPTPAPGKAPTLPPGVTPTPAPYPVPTLAPGKITGSGPKVNPQTGIPIQNIGFCEYMGVRYQKGQKWNDGCTYTCECIDDSSGTYTCTERCPRFTKLPQNCFMGTDPKDACCKVPSCTPTPAPGSATPTPGPSTGPYTGPPTAAPSPGVTGAPNPNGQVPTLAPKLKDVCVYNGKLYTQDQKWVDGCDKNCVCQDAKTGYYECTDRCLKYENLNPSCVMVPDSNDPICCQAPKCDQKNTTNPLGVHGGFTGYGLPPTPAPGLVPTPAPGIPTAPGGGTLKPGLTPSAVPTAAPHRPKVCMYKGVQYHQGQKWQDGCSYNCECLDANTGRYKCTDRCPRFPNLPTFCQLIYDPLDPCCSKPHCGPLPTLAPLPGISTLKPVALTPLPGHTLAPNVSNPQATLKPVIEFCVYNGVPFRQGQTWESGCDKICRCDDATSGQVNCDDRCPTYQALSADCTLVTDPVDSCCQIPKCLDKNTTDPTKVVTGVTGTITGSKLPDNGPLNPFTGTRNLCVYKGKFYTQGQTWQDGCTYNCLCSDASTGTYRCTERCPHYPQLPPTCTMIADPNDACCETAYCTPKSIPTAAPHLQPSLQPGQNPNLTPLPGHTFAPHTLKPGETLAPGLTPIPGQTFAPNPNNTSPSGQTPVIHACIYNNQYYQQGQMWFDGCNSKCICENSATGFYRCQERCRKYNSLPSTCTLVPDPNDPSCCKVPSCTFVTPSVPPTPGFISQPTPPSGIITGYGKVPTPMPTPAPQPGVSTLAPGLQPVINVTAKTGCLYKGKVYNINDKWDDGCDYQCTCMNDQIGKYQCVQRCQEYPNLPNRCVLIQNPNDKCCKAPYCDFINPTPFPNGVPTPAPTLTPKPGSYPILTPLPGITQSPPPNVVTLNPGQVPGLQGYCVYKGVYYTQGQTWADGCKYNCRCEDVSRGIYACSQRCQVFNNLPSNCQLLTDRNDPCCLVPDCNVYPTPRPYKPPLPGVSTPTPGITTHMPLILPTPITGSFSGTGGVFNPLFPDGQGGFSGGGFNACVYKGMAHAHGSTWSDGCDYKCQCVDGSKGFYRCTDRCPKYYYLPPQCFYQRDPKDSCCSIAKCDFTPTPRPSIAPTLRPTYPPVTGPTAKPLDMCLYTDGKQYANGTSWNDNCDRCKCEDPKNNVYKCEARCKAYSNLPSICTLVPDPVDSCCEIPKCGTFNPILGGSFNGTGMPTPGGLNEIPIGTHNIFTGSTLPGSVVTGKRDVCVYKGLVYKQGESWEDACKYVCSCDNATQGLYRCISRCPEYPAMPSYCNEVRIPGQCCPTISCDIPGFGAYNPIPQLNPTPAPPKSIAPTKPGATPPSKQIISVGYGPNITGGSNQYPGGGFPIQPSQFGSVRTQCIYKGKVYNQGEKWDDDCDYSCTCLDGRAGYYECSPKCPTYKNITQNNCYLETPTEGCCKQPKCDIGGGIMVNPNLMPGSTIPVFGSYGNGFSGFRPNSNFSITTAGGLINGGSRRGCVYKGVLYQQGQQWDDACAYHCRCIDAFAGRYQCNNKCPTYTKLPQVCALVTVPNKCCKEVRCGLPITTTTAIPTLSPPKFTATPPPMYNPDCHDKIDNCPAYGQTSCTGAYKPWAMRNCQRYCGLCPIVGVSTVKPLCEDKLTNCDEYGKSSCIGSYVTWAQENCPAYCGLCPTTPGTTVAVTIPNCIDKESSCPELANNGLCSDDGYSVFVKENCKKSCNLCAPPTTSPATVIATTPSVGTGWLLMMKGVSGVPGDLYNLWTGTGTMNANVTAASFLTSFYKGHYKPDYSNHWGQLCIDKVKVSIYNNGVEKAYILFNAQGADKNSWFTPARVIDSTWGDIKNAPKDYFSMAKDPNFGREFYISGSHTDCDSSGWIMISTSNKCQVENGNKPAFYYAPGQNQASWLYTPPAEGDVFAIQAHSTCPDSPVYPTKSGSSNGCVFKGTLHKQGDTWLDGCDYNCSCDDATTGFYTCKPLCSVYTDLPSICVVYKPSGSCCETVQCYVNGTVGGFTAPPNVCEYKHKFYHQDETWNDGCDYKCTCVDAPRGFYKCKDRCVRWNLPQQFCHLDAPLPGTCCQRPNCPSFISISCPEGYKDEYQGIC